MGVWTLQNESSHCSSAGPEPRGRGSASAWNRVDQWQVRRVPAAGWRVGEAWCQAECGLLSASIPSIHSFEEHKEVVDMAETWFIWLGATKTGESRAYAWDDGSQWSYTAFAEWSEDEG